MRSCVLVLPSSCINVMKPSDNNSIVGGLTCKNQDILPIKFLDTLFQKSKRELVSISRSETNLLKLSTVLRIGLLYLLKTTALNELSQYWAPGRENINQREKNAPKED